MLLSIIQAIPEGYSEGWYKHAKYGITKQTFNQGKSYKIYAKQLKGTNFISLNYYLTSSKALLKPCEMPAAKVIDFLKEFKTNKE